MAGRHVGSIRNNAFSFPGDPVQMRRYRKEFPGSQADQAFSEGRTAGLAGILSTANPHPARYPELRNAWGVGWFSAQTSGEPVDTTERIVQSGSLKNPAVPATGPAI